MKLQPACGIQVLSQTLAICLKLGALLESPCGLSGLAWAQRGMNEFQVKGAPFPSALSIALEMATFEQPVCLTGKPRRWVIQRTSLRFYLNFQGRSRINEILSLWIKSNQLVTVARGPLGCNSSFFSYFVALRNWVCNLTTWSFCQLGSIVANSCSLQWVSEVNLRHQWGTHHQTQHIVSACWTLVPFPLSMNRGKHWLRCSGHQTICCSQTHLIYEHMI